MRDNACLTVIKKMLTTIILDFRAEKITLIF